MAYDTYLEERLSSTMKAKRVDFLSKKMMGGLVYMVDDKMCFGIIGDNLMARIHPDFYEPALAMPHVQLMEFTGRAMKGYVLIEPDGIDMDKDLVFWVDKCLEFNPIAKSSKKKKA